jgi:hypothetical protein
MWFLTRHLHITCGARSDEDEALFAERGDPLKSRLLSLFAAGESILKSHRRF